MSRTWRESARRALPGDCLFYFSILLDPAGLGCEKQKQVLQAAQRVLVCLVVCVCVTVCVCVCVCVCVAFNDWLFHKAVRFLRLDA